MSSPADTPAPATGSADAPMVAGIRRLRFRAGVIVAALAAFCLLGAAFLEHAALTEERTNARIRAFEELGNLRAAMERTLNADIQLVHGLVSYVRARPQIRQDEFKLLAADILRASSARIRNIALARNLVISHMYPVAGNEKAIGLDYRKVPTQWPQVEKAITENRIVVAGPIDLVQGGVGIIARYPIFYRNGDNKLDNLWGVAASVIDFDSYLHLVGMDRYRQRYAIALGGRHGTGPAGDLFWGDRRVVDHDPVKLNVDLPDGSWVIYATPKIGWPRHSDNLLFYALSAAALFAVGLAIVWLDLHHNVTKLRTGHLLQRAKADLETANRELERRVLERTRKLEEMTLVAESANKAKSAFLANMSHELRTPLNAIIGFAEYMEYDPAKRIPENLREYIGHIVSAGRHLLGLVNEVLDIAQLESGKASFAVGEVHLAEVVAECVDLSRPFAGDRMIAIENVQGSPEAPVVRADATRVKQILLNLISNAIKYNVDHGRVVVEVDQPDETTTRVSVVDTGIGIPASLQGRVFEPFDRLDRKHAHYVEGTGVGLTVTKELVERMGGTIGFSSSDGGGSTFWFTLPTADAA